MTGAAISPTMKATSAQAAGHDQDRRQRRAECCAARESAPPAPAWCRPRTPSDREEERLGDIEHGDDEMTRSATSANATTSARRITGGSSALLSGSGLPAALVCLPCCCCRCFLLCLQLAWCLRACRLARNCRLAACFALVRVRLSRVQLGSTRTGSPPERRDKWCERRRFANRATGRPNRWDRERFHRKNVKRRRVDSAGVAGELDGTASPGRVCSGRASRDAHPIGAAHGTDIRRPPAFVARDQRAGPWRRRCCCRLRSSRAPAPRRSATRRCAKFVSVR